MVRRLPKDGRETSHRALTDVMGLASGELPLSQLTETSLRCLVKALDASGGVIYLYDSYDRLIKAKAFAPNGNLEISLPSYSVGEGVAGICFAEGLSISVEDVDEDASTANPEIREIGLASVLCTPLKTPSDTLGAIMVGWARSTCPSSEQVTLMEHIAGIVAQVIDRSALVERERERVRKYEVLGRIGRIITSSLDIQDVFERFAEGVGELLPFDRIVISSVMAEDGTQTSDYVTGLEVAGRGPGYAAGLNGSCAEEVAQTRSSMVIQGSSVDDLKALHGSLSPHIEAGLRSFLLVPLISKDQVVGVLHLQSSVSNAYTHHDVSVAESVATHIAGPLANAHLYEHHLRVEMALREKEEDLQKLARENSVVAEIGRIISSSPDIDEVYERFCDQVRRLIDFDRIVIALVDREHDLFWDAYVMGVDIPGRRVGDTYPLEGTVSEHVVRSQSGQIIQPDDYEELLERFPGLLNDVHQSIRSILSVPLISDDSVIGILGVRSKAQRAYTPRDLELMGRVGAQIAGAIASSQLRSGLEHESSQREVLAQIGRVINTSLNIEEVYGRFVEETRKLIDFDRMVLATVDQDKETYTHVYVSGIEVSPIAAGETGSYKDTLVAEVAKTRRASIFHPQEPNEVARFPRLIPVYEAGLRSFLSSPLISNDQVIAVLFLSSVRPNAFGERELIVAERISSQIAGAIANAGLYTELKQVETALRVSEEDARALASENAAVAEIGRIISSSLNIKEVYEGFAAKMRTLIPFDRIVISRVNLQQGTSFDAFVAGLEIPGHGGGGENTLRGSLSGEVHRTGKSITFQTDDLNEVVRRFPGLLVAFERGVRSVLAVPLIAEDTILGVLLLLSTRRNA